MAARNYSDYLHPPKPRKPKLVRRSTFPVNTASEFKIELFFPQKIYFPGESVGLDVKVNSPEEFRIDKLCVGLIRNASHVSEDSITTHEPPKELVSVTTVRNDRPGYGRGNRGLGNEIEWGGVLQIPGNIEPTQECLAYEPTTILEIRYVLQVVVYKCRVGEGRIHKETEDFPIRIGRCGDSSTLQPENSNQTRDSLLGRDPAPPALERRSAANVGCSYGKMGNKCAPPRYSNMSLTMDSIHGSTTSFETLPPNYDDITPNTMESCMSDLNYK